MIQNGHQIRYEGLDGVYWLENNGHFYTDKRKISEKKLLIREKWGLKE